MNKEKIEKARCHLEWLLDNGILASEDEPHIENILKYIRYLEQKESILDKVIDKLKEIRRELDDDGFGYYAQEITNVLNIIEGEKK